MANPTQIAKRHTPKDASPGPKKHPSKKKTPAEHEQAPAEHEQFHVFHGPLPPGSDESDDLTS